MKILITGSNGFIGSHLKESLKELNFNIDFLVNRSSLNDIKCDHIVCDLSVKRDLKILKNKYDLVIHLAAYSKATKGEFKSSLHEKINVNGTLNLVDQLILNGTKKIIFLSSANVYQNKKTSIDEKSKTFYKSSYEKSKLLCENYLERKKNSIQSVVIRSPLVYGKNVKSFFSKLVSLANYPIPLPMEGFNEKRSYISVNNLSSLIIFLLNKNWDELEKFNVINCSDGYDISITQLIKLMKASQGKKSYLFSVNKVFIKFILTSLNMDKQYDFIDTAHQLDISKIKKIGWNPPLSVQESLRFLFK